MSTVRRRVCPLNAPKPDAFLCVAFGGQRVRINSPSPLIHHLLETHLHHCLVNSEPCGGVLPLDLPSYSISDDALLTLIMNETITRLIAPCRDALILHGAGVTLTERGIALCGSSGSGKSTLTAWLVRHGFGYISDEVIAVMESDEADHVLRGFARSLVVKAGSEHVWNSLIDDPQRIRPFGDGSAWIPPEALNPVSVRQGAAMHMLVFPRYNPTVRFEAEQLSPAAAAFRLMENLVNARNLPQRGLSAVATLTGATSAYQIVYNDAALVAEWLRANP
jgi:hypothetical protein